LKKVVQARLSRPEHATAEWPNGADVEIHLYADSLQRAAKCLLERLDPREDRKAAWDTAPNILLYRQAVELGLKALVGEGAAFLKTPTDHLTVYKTRSLRWLAQIVYQIIEGALNGRANSNAKGFPTWRSSERLLLNLTRWTGFLRDSF